MSTIQHDFVEVNGIKLHVAKQGKGKKLVILLHGWPEFWYTWRLQIPVLAEEYTVWAPDMRGFNLSDKPKGIANYKADVVASDIADLIKKSGFKKAHIVGHDWGGAIAWVFATMYPELTDKLAVCNCPHPKIMLDNVKSNPMQILRSWYIFVHQVPVVPELMYKYTLPLFYKTFVKGWMFNKQNFTEEDLNAFVAAYKQEGALTSSINYYRAMLQTKPNTQILKQKIQAPTLLIWGEDDKALGKELTYGTEKYIDATFDVKYISNCSHWVQNDCPEAVNQYLLDFLD